MPSHCSHIQPAPAQSRVHSTGPGAWVLWGRAGCHAAWCPCREGKSSHHRCSDNDRGGQRPAPRGGAGVDLHLPGEAWPRRQVVEQSCTQAEEMTSSLWDFTAAEGQGAKSAETMRQQSLLPEKQLSSEVSLSGLSGWRDVAQLTSVSSAWEPLGGPLRSACATQEVKLAGSQQLVLCVWRWSAGAQRCHCRWQLGPTSCDKGSAAHCHVWCDRRLHADGWGGQSRVVP